MFIKVGRLFCKLAIPKLFVSSLFTPVKKRNIFCSGEHVKWNMKGIARIFYSSKCLCGIMHLKSKVRCQISALVLCEGSPEICVAWADDVWLATAWELAFQCVNCVPLLVYLFSCRFRYADDYFVYNKTSYSNRLPLLYTQVYSKLNILLILSLGIHIW